MLLLRNTPSRRARWSRARLAGFAALLVGALISAGISLGWLVTDLQGRHTAHRLADATLRQWAEPRAHPGAEYRPVAGIGGPVLAVVTVPRFGRSWRMPVQRGTGVAVLRQGLGLYTGSAAPGAVGNLALAGHRTTWGAPLNHLDRLRAGDVVRVWTATGRFDYRVVASGVTTPDDVSVIRRAAAHGQAMLTMTTCHPEFSARERLYVHAVLVR